MNPQGSTPPSADASNQPPVTAGTAGPPAPGLADATTVFAPGLFAGQVALVTGGGSGIGRRTAIDFARLGGDVVVAGRTEDALAETRAEVEALGRTCVTQPTNIREPAEVERLRDVAYEQFGRVDVLVNNAGGQFPALPSQISDNGWRAVVDLNLNGTWNMVNRFMEPMARAGRGSIVNVVHIFSFTRGAPWFVHSGAARAGVVNLTHTMAPYLGYHGVTINALAPGTIDTEGMQENEVGKLGFDKESWAVEAEATGPMRRMGTVAECVSVILFLASPGGRFVNGAAIVADGSESQANWPRFFDRGSL
ncbi:MAG: SDR family oxidoreductase [Acidimicrobiia bacterium]|nr:SDR family oxidoreductase [Acidimicrobiia bacterium]